MDNLMDTFDKNFNGFESDDIFQDTLNGDEAISAISDRKLYTQKSDRSLGDLVSMISKGSLNLSPDYQRSFVWKKNQQSKFIESILLGIPVPTIFISENSDSTYEVVDGQQRLTTLQEFWFDKLKLTQLQTLTEYNGMTFSTLDDTTKNLLENSRTMSVVSILKDSSPEIKFDIFQRINEGAIKLSPQELRNVIYRGPVIMLLEELGNTELFSELFNKNSNTVKRKQHQEIILRMLAIDDMTKNNNDILELSTEYNGRLDSAMTRFLEKYRYVENKLDTIKNEFNKTMEKINSVLGKERTFRLFSLSPDNNNTRLISKPLAEFEYILFKNLPYESIKDKSEVILNKLDEVFANEDNILLFQRATANKEIVKQRLDIINTIIDGVVHG